MISNVKKPVSHKIRLEPDRDVILDTLIRSNYPFDQWVLEPELFNACVVCSISKDDRHQGIVWAHFTEPNVMTAHAAALPGEVFDWKLIMPRLVFLSEFLGADELFISLEQVKRSRVIARLLMRYGFLKDLTTQTLRRKTYGTISTP